MSKKMGAIHRLRSDADEMLLIGGRRADALVAEAGDTPLFVYDLALIDAKIARFKAAFGDVHLHFAMKANPYPPLLKHVRNRVDGLDLASGGELRIALEAGIDPALMSFAGPGKRDADLKAAIEASVTLNCESEGEVERALALGGRPRLAVRVNPDFEIKGSGMRMGGGAKPFGVDAARVPDLVRRILGSHAEWRGFHIFAGSQALDPAALIEAQAATIALAAELATEIGAPPPLVNLGGGFGIPHFHGEQPLDVEAVAAALLPALAARPAILREAKFAIELGRWLVGECGVYLTRIVDRKLSHGKTFLVTDGGMHISSPRPAISARSSAATTPSRCASRFGAPAEEEVSIAGVCAPRSTGWPMTS